MASHKMWDERQNHTLTATALANEVSLKLLPERSRAQSDRPR